MFKSADCVIAKRLVIRPRLWFLIILGALMLCPLFIAQQTLQAAVIDETVPTSFPAQIIADWEDQDITGGNYAAATTAILGNLDADYVKLYDAAKASVTGEKNLYYLACHFRRIAKMKPYSNDISSIMFARHHNFGGFLVGYHDNADAMYSDAEFTSKGALCVLNMKNYYSTFTTLLDKTKNVVRDPCISFDGNKVLFAMSGGGKGTGYKIYELEIANPTSIKQLTTNPATDIVVSDFEPCYLPNGDIAFSSTRCFGMVDCAWNPTTNMFLMDGTGKYIRRVGFDQVHTFYPVLRDNGTILYTRWEYNDRVLTNCMGLFSMNPDGCHQTEVFGNQTGWPYTKIHARPIPGTGKIIAVAGGHHAPYSGELMIIDPSLGANGTKSIQMIAPKRACKATVTKTDGAAGNVQFLFQNPLPLDENNFIVSWRKTEDEKLYKLYFMDVDGKRELLAWADQSVSQPVFLKARTVPQALAPNADYSKTTAMFTMQNVYEGEGLKKRGGTPVAKGTAKTLRVIQINYRVQGGSAGITTMNGDQSSGFVSAPVAKFGASWESKTVLGETPIYPDGSAAFIVPSRKPVYFQVLDSMGYCIATMRSWSTLMPGEQFPCIGCHESKLQAIDPGVQSLAGVPTPLKTPLGIENKYFDYRKIIQPIWDAHCITCHKANHESEIDLRGDLISAADAGVGYADSKRSWSTSYVSLMAQAGGFVTGTSPISICTIFSQPEQQPAYSFGSSQSKLMTKVINGSHHDVKLTQTEKNIVACWIDLCAPHAGYYSNNMSVADSTTYAKFEAKRTKWEAIEAANIADFAGPSAVVFDNKNSKLTHLSTEQIGIKYVSKERMLVLNTHSEGNLMIVDLRGKVISCIKLSKQYIGYNVSISLPKSLGAGLYMTRFEGENGTVQRMISVIK